MGDLCKLSGHVLRSPTGDGTPDPDARASAAVGPAPGDLASGPLAALGIEISTGAPPRGQKGRGGEKDALLEASPHALPADKDEVDE